MALRRLWSWLKHGRLLSWTGFYTILGHNFCIVCSPLTIKMVELTRRHSQRLDRRLSGLSSYHYLDPKHSTRADEESWLRLVVDPRKVIECIKQYHGAGPVFFVAVAGQLGAIFYLCVKAAFHKYATQSNAELADYYADRYYFPRMFHSHSDSKYLDSEVLFCCLYILAFRLSRLYSLVKHSIINRNGYQYILAQQSSIAATTAFRLPLHKWKHFVALVYSHRSQVANDAKTRQIHRGFDKDLYSAIRARNMFEFYYFHNTISFDRCYDSLASPCTAEDRACWARDWFVPEPIMRLDPAEYAWLVTIALVGLPLLVTIVLLLTSLTVINELCAIAAETGQDSCLAQLPTLLASLSRLIRVADILALIYLLLAPQLEGSIVYWDCCVMISRVRKVRDALQGDSERCEELVRLGGARKESIDGVREELNQSIRVHLQMIRYVYQEFRDLRTCHTVFLNILLLGGGLLLSIAVHGILVSDSLFKTSILHSFVVANAALMGLSILFCILAESTVSTLIGEDDLCSTPADRPSVPATHS